MAVQRTRRESVFNSHARPKTHERAAQLLLKRPSTGLWASFASDIANPLPSLAEQIAAAVPPTILEPGPAGSSESQTRILVAARNRTKSPLIPRSTTTTN